MRISACPSMRLDAILLGDPDHLVSFCPLGVFERRCGQLDVLLRFVLLRLIVLLAREFFRRQSVDHCRQGRLEDRRQFAKAIDFHHFAEGKTGGRLGAGRMFRG